MNRVLYLTIAVFIIFTFVSFAIFMFWRLGIFKKETQPSEKMIEIQNIVQYIKNYPFQNLNQVFSKLSTVKIEIPEVTPLDLGKEKLFQ